MRQKAKAPFGSLFAVAQDTKLFNTVAGTESQTKTFSTTIKITNK